MIAAEDTHDITIRNCIVRNSYRPGILLEGPNMRVLDNLLGNAGSDSVEILTGPPASASPPATLRCRPMSWKMQ